MDSVDSYCIATEQVFPERRQFPAMHQRIRGRNILPGDGTGSSSDMANFSTRVIDGTKRPQKKRRNCPFSILGWIAVSWYCALWHNIQNSHALIHDVSSLKKSRPFITMNGRIRNLLNSLSMSTAKVEEGNESTTTSVVDSTSSFASSLRNLYKPAPSRQQYTIHKSKRRNHSYRYSDNRHDLRAHEEQNRVQLDWIVRNTAKILGDRAPAPGEMTPKLIRITTSLMRAWAKRASTIESSNAPHVVEKLLQRLLLEKKIVESHREEKQASKQTVEISLENYNSVLEAWSNSKEAGSAYRAVEILRQMEEHQENGSGPKPNLQSYNSVIKALVKNGDRRSAACKVEELVLRMESIGDPSILPNRRSYNFLLYALANSNQDDAADRATKHLKHMIDRTKKSKREEHGTSLVQPDVNSFNQVIGAWARGKTQNYLEEMQKVYDLLIAVSADYDILPDVDTYNNMMGGWLKSNDNKALDEIQTLFSTMEESYKNGNSAAQPDRVSVNSLQTAFNKFSRGSNFTRQIELENEYDLPRNSHSLNILMEGIIKSGVSDAPEQSLEILTEMENHLKNGYRMMKPDVCSYIAVIKAHVAYKRKNTERKTDELLTRMWYLHRDYNGDPPDIAVYNCVINAYASIKSNRVLNKVKDVLRKMENGETEGIPKPNLITYNTVIKAMRNGKEKGAIYAEGILSKLETLGAEDPELLPDNYSYTSVITAYARSSSSNKADKALEMIERMAEAQKVGNASAKMTAHTFNAALNSCAFVSGSIEDKARAFEIATKLDKLRIESGELGDSTWYGTMLRACSSLLPPSEYRENMVDLVFEEACCNGCVGPLVLQQLRFAAERDQQIRLLQRDFREDDYVQLSQLPSQWTCNAREWQIPRDKRG